MRVAVYYSNSDVRLEERQVPEIGEEEILVKAVACGICGSDVMEWYRIKRVPLVLGHEMTGKIFKKGRKIKGLQVGQRVFVSHHVPCNTCHYCLKGRHTVCHTLRTTNFEPGGFAEFVRIPSINVDRGLFKLPEEISYKEGVFIEPLGCVYRALRLSSFTPGQSVLIIGSGVSGLLFLKMLKAFGSGPVFTADINDFKLEKSFEFGATAFINPRKENVADVVREENGGRLAELVVVTAGSKSAVEDALNSVDRGGVILFFAPPPPEVQVDIPLAKFWKDEVTITTSYGAAPSDLKVVMELLRTKKVIVEDMITHIFPFSEIGKAFQTAAQSKNSLKVIVQIE